MKQQYTKKLLKLNNKDIYKKALISPYARSTKDGIIEYEEKPSFVYNWDTDGFKDFTNNEFYGKTEAYLCQKIENITKTNAEKLVAVFNRELKHQSKDVEFEGIKKSVFKDLNVGSKNGADFSVPVYMYNQLLDIRSYYKENKNGSKVYSETNSINGLICPFDKWVETDPNDGITIICEGEKDMLVARSNGFVKKNPAICITGGALALPIYQKRFLKDRKFFIVFDNDNAGISGGTALASFLLKNGAKSVKMTSNICQDGVEKSDLYDFFIKYNKNSEDFSFIYKNLPFIKGDLLTQTELGKDVSLKDIMTNPWLQKKRKLSSKIQVMSITQFQNYYFPSVVSIWKINSFGQEVPTGRKHYTNRKEFLYFVRNQKTIDTWLKNKYNCNKKENEFIKIDSADEKRITKYTICNIGNYSENYIAYKIGEPLTTKKYKVEIENTREPDNRGNVVFLITNAKETENLFKYMRLTDENKTILKKFQKTTKDIPTFYNNFLSYLGSYVDPHLYNLIELVFHSQLSFYYRGRVISGVIDAFLIGDTRIGKSDTYETLKKLYGQGSFINLKTITETALLGGAIVSPNGGVNQIAIGELSKNHEGIVALEELQGVTKFDVHKALTDIKSREIVKVDRVGISIETPTKLRLITMSNPKGAEINYYSNGNKIVKDLCGRAEDIARYDIVSIISALDKNIQPYKKIDKTEEEKKEYKIKIKWSMSRTKEQIFIGEENEKYIWETTKKLNNVFDGSTQYLGREGYQKVAKVSVALASWLVSTNESFDKIIVKKEHIDWVYNFFYHNYSRSEFKLNEIVKKERELKVLTEDNKKYLKELSMGEWKNHLIELCENSGRYTRKEFKDLVNLPESTFNEEMKNLDKKHKLININKERIWPAKKLINWYNSLK